MSKRDIELALIEQGILLEGTHSAFEYWWRQGIDGVIPREHKEILEEKAQDRINELVKEGFVEGELVSEIYIEGTNEDIYYRGWWKPRWRDDK